MAKNAKPKRVAKRRLAPDGGPWVNPLSTASSSKKSAAKAKSRGPATLKRELSSTAAAPAKSLAAKKTAAKAATSEARSRSGLTPGAAAKAGGAAPKLSVVRSDAPRPESSATELPSGDQHAILDQGLSEVRTLLCSTQISGEAWSGPLADSASQASRGFAELNGKMFDIMRAQADAALSLWRAMLNAHSMSDVVGLQANEMRRQAEAAATQMSDIVATTNRLAADALKPVQAFGERTRRAS